MRARGTWVELPTRDYICGVEGNEVVGFGIHFLIFCFDYVGVLF